MSEDTKVVSENTDSTATDKANSEVIVDRGSRWGRPVKWILGSVLALTLLAGLAVAGIAYATDNYEQRYEGRLLPDTRIAGIDVSGMTPERALRAVKDKVNRRLDQPIKVSWNDRTWKATPRELGAWSNAPQIVRRAEAVTEGVSFWEKARMRFLHERLDFDRRLAFVFPREDARGMIGDIAAEVDKDPQDASLDYSTGWVRITPSETGRKVLVDKARAAVMKAMRGPEVKVALPVDTLQPEVTEAAYDEVLLTRIGENKLYLYQGGKITHSWTIATGQPQYPTPTGVYSVTEKRYMPTWINPDPTGWGASMPAEIPPGRDNPLGIRALNWSASGIRFHGTEATYSLGYNASHGCVRLSNDEVVQLYNLVDVGTPIVSVEVGSYKPLYSGSSTSDPTVVADSGGSGRG